MIRRPMKHVIDTSRLARNAESLSGVLPVERLPRLASLLASADGRIDWTLRGWHRERPEGGRDEFMALSFSAALRPACVRCLEAVDVEVSDARRYRLVATEEQAERLDPDDEEYDVIAGGERFDLDSLLEDEAILALPPMPRHEACRPANAGGVDEPASVEKPLAALARLKRNGPDGGGETPR